MSHFALLWKARTIEKYRQNYENEKINSIIKSNSDIPDTTLLQRWKHYYRHDMRKRLSRTFSKWYPEGTTVSNFFVNLRTEMKLPSILLRSLSGFVGGLLLTYLGFMFFVFQLSLSLMYATVMSSVLGVLLTLGLTFSDRMRCLIFLLVPQLFSRVGRYTLTCYALVLILTGPATNTLKNSEVLSESMACSQEQIKLSVRQINDSIKKPFNSIKASLKVTVESMKRVVQKLKLALIRINRLILSIASIIQSGFSWLSLITNRCNEVLGTPHDKCLRSLKNNYEKHYDLFHVKSKHKKKLSRIDIRNFLDLITSIKRKDKQRFDVKKSKKYRDRRIVEDKDFKTGDKDVCKDKNNDKPQFCIADDVAKIACTALKPYKMFCVAADFTEDTFLATIRKKLKTFVHRISTLLHVKLNIHHTYIFIGNSSATNQIAAGIVTEIRNRADPIITWLSWSSCVTSLFLLLIFFRAKHYQHMFETRSRFDNRFITKEFRELDLKRLRERRETVLPLNRRERAKYVTTTSFRLVASEKFHLNRSAVFMTVATFKLLIHIVADYSLYWVLMTIRHHGKLQSLTQPGIADSGVFISGTGFVARLLQSFIDSLNIQLLLPLQDNSCLPNPYSPDVKRYCQIGFLIFLLWFFALFEPYGLRLRHLIMGHYRPARAKDRAVWLYNHILRTRASFMKFARRRLHREYKYSSESKLSFRRWLQTHVPFCWLKSLLRITPEEPHCLLCNITEDTSDPNTELIKCEVINCPGTYCTSCFSDIGQLCTICLSPSDYGDLSDVSLEKGSSDEDESDESEDYNKDPENNDLGGDNKISSDCADNLEDEYDDATLRCFKQQRMHYLSKKNEKRYSETFLLLENRNTVCHTNSYCVDITQKKYTFYTRELQAVISNNECNRLCKHLELQKATLREQEFKDSIAISKDYNNNKFYYNTISLPIESFQYGVCAVTKNHLEIEKSESITTIAKYLRKKKIIRCKQKDAGKKIKYFMTCSYNNLHTINEATMRGDANGDKAKDCDNLKNCKSKTKSIKVCNNKTENNTTKVKSKNCNVNKGKFHNAISKCWKNFKLTILPFKDLGNTKRDLPPIKEKKHKRKKKRKKAQSQANISKLHKRKITGNSRLFAYLDERVWAENNFDKENDYFNEQLPKNCCNKVEDKIFINNIEIPALDLNLSSESIFEPIIITTERINYAENALDRFFKSIDKSCEDLEAYTYSNCKDTFKTNKIHKQCKLKRVLSEKFSEYKDESLHIIYRKQMHKKEEKLYNKENCIRKKKNRAENKKQKQITHHQQTQVSNGTQCTTPISIKIVGKQCGEDHKDKNASINLSIQRKNKCHTLTNVKVQKNVDKDIQTLDLYVTKTDDKEVTVFPLMKSRGCQKDLFRVETQDFSMQVGRDGKNQKIKQTASQPGKKVLIQNPICSCTPKHRNLKREVGDTCFENDDESDRSDSSTEEHVHNLESSTTETVSSINTDTSGTDTTVFSIANMNFRMERGQKGNVENKRLKVKVITKSNQSTLTDKNRNCDVSTATDDWWSPIVERKSVPKTADRLVEKWGFHKKKETKVFKTRGVSAKEKAVTFRSSTQIIPGSVYGIVDVLSPSRYLLESQKYYNKLFYTKTSQVLPVTNIQKYQNLERERSQISSSQHTFRGRKTKRLEASHTPRKHVRKKT